MPDLRGKGMELRIIIREDEVYKYKNKIFFQNSSAVRRELEYSGLSYLMKMNNSRRRAPANAQDSLPRLRFVN